VQGIKRLERLADVMLPAERPARVDAELESCHRASQSHDNIVLANCVADPRDVLFEVVIFVHSDRHRPIKAVEVDVQAGHQVDELLAHHARVARVVVDLQLLGVADGRELDVARSLRLELRARRLTALAHRRLPELDGVTVALLLAGGWPVVSASVASPSTITISIINFREVTISGVTIAGVTTARSPWPGRLFPWGSPRP
jgi:hypothetical protein